MGKSKRKPLPSPPKWYWYDSYNCWFCKNRRNCGSCKVLKEYSKQQEEKHSRQDKEKLKKQEYEDL